MGGLVRGGWCVCVCVGFNMVVGIAGCMHTLTDARVCVCRLQYGGLRAFISSYLLWRAFEARKNHILSLFSS